MAAGSGQRHERKPAGLIMRVAVCGAKSAELGLFVLPAISLHSEACDLLDDVDVGSLKNRDYQASEVVSS